MSYSVRKAESGSGWHIIETFGRTHKILKHFGYRREARDWLRAYKAGQISIDGEPMRDTSVWRDAATPFADNH